MKPETSLDKQDKAEITNYTRVPNMLIFGYHDTISPQEKWLYVCLKHLCGKKGTRHLSLRYIAEQSGISVGALSKSKHSEGMIKHLHDAGLIHAEIKRPGGKGNAQYHVTITDVWVLNQAFFRSEFGQDEDVDAIPVRNSDEPVQNSDRLVHFSDKVVQNSDEPVRISSNTKTSKITEQDYYKITEQEREYVSAGASTSHAPLDLSEKDGGEEDTTQAFKVIAPALTLPSKHTPSPARDGKHERKDGPATVQGSEPVASGSTQAKPKRGRKEKPPVEELPAEVVQFLDDWDSLHRAPLPRTERLIALAKGAVKAKISHEELEGCRNWLPTTDRPGKPYYRQKGVGLWDIVDKIGEYRSLQNMPIPGVPIVDMKPRKRPKPEDKNISIFEYDPSWQVWKRKDDEQEWIWWQGEFCTPEEADERGYGGGFGLYEGHAPQQHLGGVN